MNVSEEANGLEPIGVTGTVEQGEDSPRERD